MEGEGRARSERGKERRHARNTGIKRTETKTARKGIYDALSRYARKGAQDVRGQEEEPEEEREAEGPGQGASVCESAVEGS